MSFQSKNDYFKLATAGSALCCTDDADGRSASVATAMKEDGTVVASEVYGEICAPTNTYKVAGSYSGTFKLGLVEGSTVTVGSVEHKIVLNNVTLNTGAASEPTITAAGQMVESA